MFSNLCIDGWEAVLSDGSKFLDGSLDLQGKQHSPWRELEKISKERSLDIVKVVIFKGLQIISFDKLEGKLVTGTATHDYTDLATGVRIVRNFRWVRREEQCRWLWGICDDFKSWCVETSPGVEMCPDPYSLEGAKDGIP